jgi:hypothetical protein
MSRGSPTLTENNRTPEILLPRRQVGPKGQSASRVRYASLINIGSVMEQRFIRDVLENLKVRTIL